MASTSRSVAEGEGGSASSQGTSAHASAHDVNKASSETAMASFLKRGEEILDTFTASIRGFEAQTLQMKKLETMVHDMQNSHKTNTIAGEKRKADENDSRPTSAKRPRSNEVSDSVSIHSDGELSERDPYDELDNELSSDNKTDDMLEDMNSFFETEQVVGQNINENVALMIDAALKSSLNKDKVNVVLDRNRRPGNVERLQVPKIDNFLWDQLKNPTKTLDAQRQKVVGQANQALVPIIRAMDHLKSASTPELPILRECITDAFKILTAQITTTNQLRRENIKQELMPHLRSVCDDQVISPTRLFGDNLVEKLKQMDQGKQIKVTHKQPFLGKGRGERPGERRHTQHSSVHKQNQKRENSKFQGLRKTSNFGAKSYQHYGKTWKNGPSTKPRYQ